MIPKETLELAIRALETAKYTEWEVLCYIRQCYKYAKMSNKTKFVSRKNLMKNGNKMK